MTQMGMRIVDEDLSEPYRSRRPSRRGIPTNRPTQLCRSSRRWRYVQLLDAGLDEINSWRLATDVTIDLHRFIQDLECDAVAPGEAVKGGALVVDRTWREEPDGGRHG